MISYMKDQVSSISETMLDRKAFRANYEAIINNKISAMNKQMKQYMKASIDAIKEEIYQEMIQEIDIDGERERVKNALRKNEIPQVFMKQISLPKFSVKKNVDKFADETVVDAYLHSSKDDVAKYARKVQNFKKYSKNYIDSVSDFEEEVVAYKNDLKKKMGDVVPYLIDKYTNFMSDVLQRKEPEDSFSLNPKINIKYDRKFETYLKNAIREMLKNV